MATFSVNKQSLLTLAWLANQPQLREMVIQAPSPDGTRVLEAILEQEIQFLVPYLFDRFARVYLSLLRHQIVLVDLMAVQWAIRGSDGVSFKEEKIPSWPDPVKNRTAKQSVTQVFGESLREDQELFKQMQRILRDTGGEKRGERMQQLFLAHPVFPLAPEAFLLPELLSISLAQINWAEIADLLMEPTRE